MDERDLSLAGEYTNSVLAVPRGAQPDWEAAKAAARTLPVASIERGEGMTGLPGVWADEPEAARELLVDLVDRVERLWETGGPRAYRFEAGTQDVLVVEGRSYGGWASDAQLDLESLSHFGLDAPAGFAEPDYTAVDERLPKVRTDPRP